MGGGGRFRDQYTIVRMHPICYIPSRQNTFDYRHRNRGGKIERERDERRQRDLGKGDAWKAEK